MTVAAMPKLAVQTPFNATPVAGDPWAFDCTLITAGPGNPANKFYYPPEWISDPLTAKLYNGAQCYIDHDGYMDMENRPERSMRDLLAYWSNVHLESNALKGRLNIVPSASNEIFRDQIAVSIKYREQFPDKNFCGFSIVQQGDFEPFDFQGDTWKKVIRTNTVKSVDLVTLPARGGQADAPVTAESNRPLAEKWAVESLRGMIAEMEKNGSFVAWMKESGQSPTAFAKYTLPEKSGEAEEVTSGGDVLSILTALRDKVAASPDDQPMKHELRRGLDAALSAYQQKNSEGGSTVPKPKDDGTTSQHIKTKPGMTVAIQHAPEQKDGTGGTAVPTATPDDDSAGPDAQDAQAAELEQEAQRCEEAAEGFQKMSETSQEAESKGKFQKMAEGMKGMAASKRQKASEAKAKAEAMRKSKAAEAEKEGEGEEEAEEEQEALRQIAVETLMREADLPEHVSTFVKKQIAGKKLPVIKKLIEDAKGLVQREAGGYRPMSPARQVSGAGAKSPEFSSFLKEC